MSNADFVMKAFDTKPYVEAVLGFEPPPDTATVDEFNAYTQALADLSTALNAGATVLFILRAAPYSAVGTPKVEAAAVLVDAAKRIVRYEWATGDTDTPGEYLFEFQVTYPDGSIETFPTGFYNTLDILADLNGGV